MCQPLSSGTTRSRLYLCLSIASHNQSKGQKIQDSEQVLCEPNVGPLFRHIIQQAVDVDVDRWIDQRSRVASDFGIVALACDVLGDLLHIRLPVDLGI